MTTKGHRTTSNVDRKATAFLLWRAIDKRWNRNTVSLVSSVTAVMRLLISWISSIADWFQVPAVSTATGKKMWEAESVPYVILFAAVLFAAEHAALAVWSMCEYYYSVISIAPRLHDAANRYINSYALNKKKFQFVSQHDQRYVQCARFSRKTVPHPMSLDSEPAIINNFDKGIRIRDKEKWAYGRKAGTYLQQNIVYMGIGSPSQYKGMDNDQTNDILIFNTEYMCISMNFARLNSTLVNVRLMRDGQVG